MNDLKAIRHQQAIRRASEVMAQLARRTGTLDENQRIIPQAETEAPVPSL